MTAVALEAPPMHALIYLRAGWSASVVGRGTGSLSVAGLSIIVTYANRRGGAPWRGSSGPSRSGLLVSALFALPARCTR